MGAESAALYPVHQLGGQRASGRSRYLYCVQPPGTRDPYSAVDQDIPVNALQHRDLDIRGYPDGRLLCAQPEYHARRSLPGALTGIRLSPPILECANLNPRFRVLHSDPSSKRPSLAD